LIRRSTAEGWTSHASHARPAESLNRLYDIDCFAAEGIRADSRTKKARPEPNTEERTRSG
jgi:hypothetical protein